MEGGGITNYVMMDWIGIGLLYRDTLGGPWIGATKVPGMMK